MSRWAFSVVMVLLLAGCSDPASDTKQEETRTVSPPPSLQTSKVERSHDAVQVERGRVLYAANCMACHGDQAQGAVNWQKRDAKGRFPPPPLNGTGHAWHHPTKILKYTISNGTGNIGGNMPAFRGKLSDAEMEDILEFLKQKWPDPLYEAWFWAEQRSLKPAQGG